MKILAIETSCDETGAAIVEDGRSVLTNALATSLATHIATGGVIPENAAREQLHYLVPVLKEATINQDYDVIAVTQGPGLIGSLLIGVEAAKALAFATGKKLIAVNHLYGHIYASWLSDPEPQLPAIVLIASGAHSDLVYLNQQHQLEYLGGTRDDAAGEAFDKTARLLGLSYPGGPEISREAKHGTPGKLTLPRPMLNEANFDFSFSGLKTAVRTVVTEQQPDTADVALAVEDAITDILVAKTIRAAKERGVDSIILGGGVVANSILRNKFSSLWDRHLFFPEIKYSTDNAAMIGAAAYFHRNFVDPLTLTADASLSLRP